MYSTTTITSLAQKPNAKMGDGENKLPLFNIIWVLNVSPMYCIKIK